MGVLFDALRSVDFLDGASAEIVTRFMVLGRSEDHLKGHVFWRAGAEPHALVVAVTGEAKTSTFSSEGREFIDRFVGTGECVGLIGALDGLPHATDAHVTRTGEFFTISRDAFVRCLDEHPAVRAKTAATLGAVYRRVMMERESVSLRPVPQRVAEFLLRHGCVRESNGARVLIHATQAEIAARLGTVREVVSRILTDFRQRGLLARDAADGILIPDWEGLAAEADAGCGAATAGRAPAPTHAARTRRYFLPMAERRRRREPAEDAAPCRERLGDLTLCCARGCPVAIEDRAARRHETIRRWRVASAARRVAPAALLQRV